LPSASFCSLYPIDAACAFFNPPNQGATGAGPIGQAINNTINVAIITTNTTGPGATTPTTGSTGGGPSSGAKTDDTKKEGPTDRSGVNNEPIKKLYCN
jgi:hypothetical protein